ncbi:endolytic transglycosylase MltG [Streptomyces sp. NPDC050856]|uniref:endolytic transglycosylase MltG n=1 Tax=Streptomyces sp. NPDC050856 TaxID=3154939 RepID=UPI0033EB6034
MTEYGRGSGSAPWHPEDPLYGDPGWEGQQAGGRQQHDEQAPYGSHQDPYGQQPQGYGDRHPQTQPQHAYQQQAQEHDGQPYDAGWDTGQQSAMPYGAPPVPADPYGGHAPDTYSTPEAYPPPQPPGQRQPEPQHRTEHEPRPQEPEPSPAFLSDGDGGDDRDGGGSGSGDDEEPGGAPDGGRRGARERRGKQKKKSRNGLACLIVTLVLAGGAGGVGYFGYQFWQGQFGEAPDFVGAGTSETVEVVIPPGAGGYEIGGILVKNGVVKSTGAFVSAQEKIAKNKPIQEGAYTLKKGMSAASAIELMLSPASRNSLTVPEGKRNAWVYAAIDKRLELPAGTTRTVAGEQAGSLGLPDWATRHPDVKDPLEGFLFPASYPVAKGSKPQDVLKKMVARANEEYGKLNLEAKAQSLDLEGPWQLLTVASLVQVEGKTEDDFRKMSEVVYNRLKPTNTETNQLLQFDSAFNYLKGQSEIEISESEINSNKDPYNTYTQKGLTPGPISNPGAEALAAALNPTKDGWMYFVATDGMHKTEFAKTHAEFLELKDKFNDNQGSE